MSNENEVQFNEELVTETETKRPSRSKKADKDVADNKTESDSVDNVNLTLGIYKLNPNAQIPKFETENSACFDLSACFEIGDTINVINQSNQTTKRKVGEDGLIVYNGERVLIPTGLIFDIPTGYYLDVRARSGISYKRGVTLSNCVGTIDSDYVEQLYVSVHNIGGSQHIANGERVAQAKLERLVETNIQVIEERPKQKTNRKGGFGSTGTK